MTDERHRYWLYDMVVESAKPLVLCEARGVEADEAETWVLEEGAVEFDRGRLVHDVADFDGKRRLKVWFDGDSLVLLSYGETGIEWDGRERRIRIDGGDDLPTRAGIALERMAAPIACMLQRSGWIALHASAVGDGDGNAWIFIGNSGAGKSTTAIELNRRGMALLADDLVLLDVSRGELVVATPTVRLFDGPAQVPEATDRELVMPEIRKYWYRLPDDAHHGGSRASVRGVFSLEPRVEAKACAIEEVRGRAATVRLLSQSFDLTEAPARWKKERFRAVCEFVRRARVWRVEYPKSGRGRPVQVEALSEFLRE